MRLFVAVWPPPPVVEAVEALERPATDGVRWTAAEQWHVTLRFLGAADLEVAVAALRSLAGTPGAVATVGWPPVRFGREVLALPVSGLEVLAALVGSAFADVGRPDSRPAFRGHLTLARGRGVRSVSPAGPFPPLPFPVRALDLVQSHLGRDGARYESVAAVALEQP